MPAAGFSGRRHPLVPPLGRRVPRIRFAWLRAIRRGAPSGARGGQATGPSASGAPLASPARDKPGICVHRPKAIDGGRVAADMLVP